MKPHRRKSLWHAIQNHYSMKSFSLRFPFVYFVLHHALQTVVLVHALELYDDLSHLDSTSHCFAEEAAKKLKLHEHNQKNFANNIEML